MEEESFLHSVTLRDSVTGGENARRTGRPGGRALGLCASPLMGQDHNMSSNLAGKVQKEHFVCFEPRRMSKTSDQLT